MSNRTAQNRSLSSANYVDPRAGSDAAPGLGDAGALDELFTGNVAPEVKVWSRYERWAPDDAELADPAEEAIETTALSHEECLRLLAEHEFGRLAVVIGEGAR